jgi:hypothetical protein
MQQDTLLPLCSESDFATARLISIDLWPCSGDDALQYPGFNTRRLDDTELWLLHKGQSAAEGCDIEVNMAESLPLVLASLWTRRQEVQSMMGYDCDEIPCRFGQP